MNKTAQLFSGLLIFGLITTFGILYFARVSAERQIKKAKEIERIESHSYKIKSCEQYALVAEENGWYPCFRCDGMDSIYLYVDEVWKYGKTCNGEQGRYSGGFPTLNVRFVRQFSGTEEECLIEEKHKIYNYPNLPECKRRNFYLFRPPGNKIDR